MNVSPVIRWLLPLSGLLAGLVTGAALRPSPPRKHSAKSPGPPPVVRTASPALSEVIFEDLNLERKKSLSERTRIEDAILKLTPAEALRRALADVNSYKGVYLFDPFAHQLLWYRAASEDPARVWEEVTAWVKRNSNEQIVSLPGLFLAWVEKDPAAALAAAKASGDTWTIPPPVVDTCIAAWAARDAPACAQAFEVAELKNTEPLLQNWVASDPAAALAWAEKKTGSLRTAYTSWAKADPLSACHAALETALAAPPPPENSGQRGQASSCLEYSFYTFIARFP
ncbi:MAG TPA: hypothetical protein VHM91_13710, partial [Verrucomicrobiales bacterium]|nr:hypothetical protein [Verrucomicrobiales bacterium]